MTKGSVHTILKELEETQYGEHIMIIHPRVSTLSKAYSRYTKNQLVNNNEVVLMIPYYETPDQVKNNLSTKGNGSSDGNDSNNNSTSIDIEKHSKEGSLIIMDGVKAHFRPDLDIQSFINELEKHAKSKGKKGISIFVDMASHYHFGNPDDVVHHELSLPSRYHNMSIKRFCVYHEKDFGRLQEEQKQVVRKHHGKELQITEPA